MTWNKDGARIIASVPCEVYFMSNKEALILQKKGFASGLFDKIWINGELTFHT